MSIFENEEVGAIHQIFAVFHLVYRMCVLTSNSINRTICCDYIWDEVQKMSDMRSFVGNVY